MNLPATGAATSVSGKNSQSLNLFGASFSSTLATSISQHFRLLAEPAGNNTTTPSGTLNLQYATGTGTPAETGISFTSGGIFKAKTVNATTLSGNGASVTNVNAAKLGGFLPSAFARLGVNDNFTGSVTAASFSTGGNVSGATGSFTGNVNVGGAEAVTGNLSSGGTVSGATGSFTGNLNVGGAASVTGNLTSGATISGVTGAFSGNLGVSGNGVFSGSVGIGVAPTALLTLSQANGSGTLTAATPLQSIANTHDASSSVALAEPFATWRVGVNRPPDNLTLLDAFYIYNQSTNSTKMAITFGGNVGIGTTNPSSLLSVAGPIESTSGGFKQPAGNTIAQEYWAVVNSDGSLAQGSGATASAVVTGFTGAYEVDFSTDVSACAYVATPSFGPAFIYVQPRFNNVKGVFVQTHNSSGSVANFGFHLVVHC